MVTMIPSDIEEFITEGEKTFGRCLKSVVKPNVKYLCC